MLMKAEQKKTEDRRQKTEGKLAGRGEQPTRRTEDELEDEKRQQATAKTRRDVTRRDERGCVTLVRLEAEEGEQH